MRDVREKLAMSIGEASMRASLGRDHLYCAIREGRLEAKKVGRRTLITLESLERYLRELPPLRLATSAPPSD